MPPDAAAIRKLAARQLDVVTRTQLLEIGVNPRWIAHRLADGQWQRLFPGAYVVHGGPVPWRSRAAAAVAYAGEGAALSHHSAAFVHGFRAAAPERLDLSVDHRRRVLEQTGLVIHRRRRPPPASGRPRTTARAATVLDVADALDSPDDVVGIVCAAVRAGTRPEEIDRALAARPRARHRPLLVELLPCVADGVESPLERRYSRDVERRHGLPRAILQVRERLDGRWIRCDAAYLGLGVRIELDGALAHPGGRTDRDTWRDNAVVVAHGEITLRYRWAHVVGAPCEVAQQVALALRSRGWAGTAQACSGMCRAGDG